MLGWGQCWRQPGLVRNVSGHGINFGVLAQMLDAILLQILDLTNVCHDQQFWRELVYTYLQCRCKKINHQISTNYLQANSQCCLSVNRYGYEYTLAEEWGGSSQGSKWSMSDKSHVADSVVPLCLAFLLLKGHGSFRPAIQMSELVGSAFERPHSQGLERDRRQHANRSSFMQCCCFGHRSALYQPNWQNWTCHQILLIFAGL